MHAAIDRLLEAALALGVEERSALVVALLDSLDGEDPAIVSEAWADEVRRRKAELRAGVARTVPWSEARARLKTP